LALAPKPSYVLYTDVIGKILEEENMVDRAFLNNKEKKMLKTQKEYLAYLQELETKLGTIKLSEAVRDSFSIENLKSAIKERELLIPVVGAFSAGKSSLINSFLEKEVLPVGITPETALATELRYVDSSDERIEAVKADSTFDIFPVEEIANIGKSASKYKFIRLFISSAKLLEIQPLILVDMPGFESPLDLHNQAIMEYINKGVHYIVLTSVEDGTITRSMIRQLKDIQEYKRDFSFFLSKSNLRSNEEVISIKNTFQQAISDNLDLDKQVVAIDDDGGNSLKQVLAQIAPEELFKSLFVLDLKNSYYSITESINTCVTSLGRSREENEQAIKELQQSLVSIVAKRDNMLLAAKEKYSDVNVNRIVDNIGKELSNSLEELVAVATSNGQDALSSTVSEIVRHALISNINTSMDEIGNDIIDMFSINLSGLNDSISNSALSEDFINRIKDSSRRMLDGVQSGLQDLTKGFEDNKKLYKTLTTVLAVTTNILAPIVELLIIFLPEILNGLMANFQKKQQEERIRNAIITKMIPALKRKLRESLPQIFNKQVEDMIKNISAQFENEIAKKRDTISSTQKEIKEKITDIDETIATYTSVSNEIKSLANNTVFK